MRQPGPFLQEIAAALKPGGRLLIVEPVIHVPGEAFARTVSLAERLGFAVQGKPPVRASRAALFHK
jgi:SAM-dependent methyltransferase